MRADPARFVILYGALGTTLCEVKGQAVDRDKREHGKRYTLLGADGQPYSSDVPGTLGGNRRGKIYGRLDCPSALRAIRQGGYIAHRVFFLDEATAIAAGYRPCGTCMRDKYKEWKAAQEAAREGRETWTRNSS